MPKILYVEDNDDNLYMLSLRFETVDGFEIVSALDGEAGIAEALASKPDLVLMDLNLPVVDGWEAMRRLKADERTSAIPIIALSAHAMAGDRERALASGADDFDTKPVDFERLLGKIRRALAQVDGKAI